MVLVSCIITCHKEDPSRIIDNILGQTWSNNQLLVFCSGINIKPLHKKYPRTNTNNIEFFDVPNRRDWGHSKRAMGLTFAEGDYMCFVNADDEYDPDFLKLMVEALEKEKADFAYCNWKDKSRPDAVVGAELKLGGMTSGNFMVRSNKAKKVGWQHRVYAADWYFVRDLLREGIEVVYFPHALMKHN